MKNTPEGILLKLIQLEDSEIYHKEYGAIEVRTSKGWYKLSYIEESKTKNESYYTLSKSFGYNSNIDNGVVFKYQPISHEFMWKYLKGEAPKEELINEIFE